MNGKVPRFDYREQYRAIRSKVLEAIDLVLESGELILGPKVASLEAAVVGFLGIPQGHGVGVASGTDAISIALRALEIGAGDEVLTVSHTAVGTVSAIRMAGAIPVFCDIDPQTLLMDPRDAAKRITPRTRAIVPVHLHGNAVDMPAVLALARAHNLRVVEDCAQSLGTLLHRCATGTWGDIGCFSFYPTKNLGGYGDGGMCVTSRSHLAERMRAIRSYGCRSGQVAEYEGVNSRLDELHAAVLEVKMRYLPDYLYRRRKIAGAYRKHLSPTVRLAQATAGADHSYHLFVIEVDHRETMMSRLHDAQIECGIHYPTPVHQMPAYARLSPIPVSLPITERAASRVLSLPCYPELALEAIEHVCGVVNQTLAG